MGYTAGAWAQEVQEEEISVEAEAKDEKPDYSLLPKNPKKATIFSAILPGAGQVYNGKAWKVPLIYGGFITDIYFINFNNRRYQIFKQALADFDEGLETDFPSLNRDGLVRNVNYWRKNRDLCYLLLVGIYALNIIDANVDAHLSGFDVSDDIALNFEPHFESFSANNRSVGLSVKLKF
ncbi:DUF5683 domain-containing protein [Algoriphagus halophytocola]|uniref:DUF5683 domain-containing protein n=1 Tax=Algoriphagus halophytocola TaxID=2991499 RepID=A0ABY6MJR4_9BACT|nr:MULTISPECIES: DUF5683 domain-containing protein [unclassified Algoriphagus]UZD22434.1 DUF5683 domain-containing protein [Algoriphagus sp. TR-M5]WBL43694.1 DUF5683 domain-containing protein [Algoriphagus sp. TR-M9]